MSEKCDRGHYYVSLPAKLCCKIRRCGTRNLSLLANKTLLQAWLIKGHKMPFCKYGEIKVNIRRINGL